jgi:hypothetical protein
MNMAVHGADFRAVDARQRHQLEMNRHEILADDMQLGFGQQVVNIGDPAGDRVFDRDHRQVRFTLSQRIEGVFEGGARQGLHGWKHVTARHVGICAKLALKGDAVGGSGHQVCPF